VTNDETLLYIAGIIVEDAHECALNLWAFHLAAAGRYQDHAQELLRILAGLRSASSEERQEMRIMWECMVHVRVEWWREREG
jgi:hypothetical protein